ncbi:ATPase, T2SS/T4P/T4SS family [Halomicrobium salinisoli]|uniref:ATPase, T2SS/T4P/T4SS family n=1 Tax=Halomicrobium salinisoli TaxID=2878391 RepID=UPI001CF0CEC4|nr:ATPase, T2SS/T4P/T4SS family [Halomicrobium salinisoli]
MRDWFRSGRADPDCRCSPRREGGTLAVDADDCPGEGRLADAADCRATVIEAADADVERVVVRRRGTERAYLDGDAGLLAAAGRFAERVAPLDERLAERTLREPVAAAREATGRAGPVADAAAESGLALAVERFESAADLRPYVGSTVGHARVAVDPPPDGRLVDRCSLPTGATVRRYERPDDLPVYHLEPAVATLSDEALGTLAEARERLAAGAESGTGAARRAVRAVAGEDEPVDRLGSVLEKHAADYGVLVDLFADERVSDVFATAPVAETPLRVRVDGDLATTNVRVSERGTDALASQLRLESGRAFSRAEPTLDATISVGVHANAVSVGSRDDREESLGDRRVRVAGTTDPVTDGVAFAFRAHGSETWTLRRLVETGTVTPRGAAVLSLAVERGTATLVAGPRGAGKTTTLGALLRELPRDARTLVIEDTPELPVEALQAEGRDVQSMLTASGDGPGLAPAAALRTALRLGEGVLAVGEVRGEEASVLYEAMRVGANASAVLGTIHGDGAESVLERVVADLGVAESAFAATDLVVTMAPPDGDDRHVAAVEEVIDGDDGVRFAPLLERDGGRLAPTGRVDRGNSGLIASLREGEERYADVLDAVEARADRFRTRGGATPGGAQRGAPAPER